MTKKQRKTQEALKIKRFMKMSHPTNEEIGGWPLSKIMDFVMKHRHILPKYK